MTTTTGKITGETWLDMLLAQSRTDRIRMANQAVTINDDTEQGRACFFQDHDSRIAALTEQIGNVRAALDEITASEPEMSDAARPGVAAVVGRIARIIGHHPHH